MNNNSETKETARRYSKGKLRYDLLPQEAIEEIVKVYTNGANKYSDFDDDGNMIYDAGFNWRKGQNWLELVACAKRHIAEFEKGEDFDPDPEMKKTLHLANACWNLMAVLTAYKTNASFDNRLHWYKRPFKKVYLDVDGCIADFEQYYLKYLNLPEHHALDWNDYRFKENDFYEPRVTGWFKR